MYRYMICSKYVLYSVKKINYLLLSRQKLHVGEIRYPIYDSLTTTIALDLTYVSNHRILVKRIEIFGVLLKATNDSLRHAYAQNHDLPLIFSWSQNNQNKSNIEETQGDPSQENRRNESNKNNIVITYIQIGIIY